MASSVSAIVVAGGSSRRMGFDKLRADLGGRPVFLHCLETLAGCPEIGEIILVVSEVNRADFRDKTQGISKLKKVIAGGMERHFSVAAGLAEVGDAFPLVAVHDAARPLLTAEDLAAVIAAAQAWGAACLATPVTDTLKRADEAGCVVGTVDRVALWQMQTPQVFSRERLREAYAEILKNEESVTDEASAVAKLGDSVKLVPPQHFNFKITYSCDIDLARAALQNRK